jgi:hypothetical protein
METKEQRDSRRIALHSEIGGAIGPIIERESGIKLERTLDCVDVLTTHITEILATYYNLTDKDAHKIFGIMSGQTKQFINVKLRKANRERDKTKSEIVIP